MTFGSPKKVNYSSTKLKTQNGPSGSKSFSEARNKLKMSSHGFETYSIQSKMLRTYELKKNSFQKVE